MVPFQVQAQMEAEAEAHARVLPHDRNESQAGANGDEGDCGISHAFHSAGVDDGEWVQEALQYSSVPRGGSSLWYAGEGEAQQHIRPPSRPPWDDHHGMFALSCVEAAATQRTRWAWGDDPHSGRSALCCDGCGAAVPHTSPRGRWILSRCDEEGQHVAELVAPHGMWALCVVAAWQAALPWAALYSDDRHRTASLAVVQDIRKFQRKAPCNWPLFDDQYSPRCVCMADILSEWLDRPGRCKSRLHIRYQTCAGRANIPEQPWYAGQRRQTGYLSQTLRISWELEALGRTLRVEPDIGHALQNPGCTRGLVHASDCKVCHVQPR